MTPLQEDLVNEAFMMGRIYNKGGEKETPAEIDEKLCEKMERIITLHNNKPKITEKKIPLVPFNLKRTDFNDNELVLAEAINELIEYTKK